MSERKDEQKRLEPSPLEIALLREIGDRLLSIDRSIREGLTIGFAEPIEPVALTVATTTLYPPKSAWFSVTVWNDGLVNIQVMVITPIAEEQWARPWAMWHTMLPGEVYAVNFNKPEITAVLMRTVVGVAVVRVAGVR